MSGNLMRDGAAAYSDALFFSFSPPCLPFAATCEGCAPARSRCISARISRIPDARSRSARARSAAARARSRAPPGKSALAFRRSCGSELPELTTWFSRTPPPRRCRYPLPRLFSRLSGRCSGGTSATSTTTFADGRAMPCRKPAGFASPDCLPTRASRSATARDGAAFAAAEGAPRASAGGASAFRARAAGTAGACAAFNSFAAAFTSTTFGSFESSFAVGRSCSSSFSAAAAAEKARPRAAAIFASFSARSAAAARSLAAFSWSLG